MFVKPAPGRAPRDPATMLRVPSTGQPIPEHSVHWATLIRAGDVVVVEQEEPQKPAAEAEPALAAEAAAPETHQ